MYKTGVPNDLENVHKKTSGPVKWEMLSDFCFKKSKNINILDVGCGDGNKMLYLIENGYKNVSGIEYCRDVYEARIKDYPDLSINSGNAEDLIGMESEKFDVVYCCHVLEHLPNPELAVQEAYRVLKDDGAYIIGLPNGYHLADIIMRMVQKLVYGKTEHLQKFDLNKISSLLKNSGFNVVEVQKHYGSLDFIFDNRLIMPNFIKNVLYRCFKMIYWQEIAYDILATKPTN